MFVLPRKQRQFEDFPPVEDASPEGLLAIGGDLGIERLLRAYRRGIFPWYSPGQPILWWSPNPRTVLFPDRIRVSKSMSKTIRQRRFRVTADKRFNDVIQGCAAPRTQNPNAGTWITAEMTDAYRELHALGYAHSVETWNQDRLVGGLYGVSLGHIFFGESMYSYESNASKFALICLAYQLQAWNFAVIDCQLPSSHIFRLGAEEIPRSNFLATLSEALRAPDRRGSWEFDNDLELFR